MLYLRSLRLSSFLFILFVFILLLGSYFHHCIFQFTYLFFCLSYSAIDSYISFQLLCFLWLFFSSSKSLLNCSVCEIFTHLYYHFSLSFFQVDYLFLFSFVLSCRFLLGFFICHKFSVMSFLLIREAVFLSYWLFGLWRPALELSGLEFAGSWVEPGRGAEKRTSVKVHIS